MTHRQDAEAALSLVDLHSADHDRIIAIAQAKATLAVADQLRASNLIALATPQQVPMKTGAVMDIALLSYSDEGELSPTIAELLEMEQK
jgi:hypothetical protein